METKEVTAVRWRDLRALSAQLTRLEEWMTNELGKKKDTVVSEMELRGISDRLNRPYSCSQEPRLATIEMAIKNLTETISRIADKLRLKRRVQMGGIIALVVAITSGAGYLAKTVEKTEAVTLQVRQTGEELSKLTMSSRRLEMRVGEMSNSRGKESGDNLRRLRQMLREELREERSSRIPRTSRKTRSR